MAWRKWRRHHVQMQIDEGPLDYCACGADWPCPLADEVQWWGTWIPEWKATALHEPPGVRALVLAWDGEPVVEGLDRLSRVAGWALLSPHELLFATLPRIARDAAEADIGTLILLDASGQEITP